MEGCPQRAIFFWLSWNVVTSSLEDDACKGDIFTRSTQQEQCGVDWSLQARDALASNGMGARHGRSHISPFAFFTLISCVTSEASFYAN